VQSVRGIIAIEREQENLADDRQTALADVPMHI